MRVLILSVALLISAQVQATGFASDSLSHQKGREPAFNYLIPGVAGMAVFSFILDSQINQTSRSNQQPFFQSLANYTDMGGEKRIVVPSLILTYGLARFLIKNEKLHSASLNSIQSVIVTAVATETIKIMAGRARPFVNEGPYTFNPFPGEDRYKSLPSGHVSLAFALFTPFAETYSRWIYVVPVAVAYGRIYQDKHWFSDAMTGGGIGLVSGLLFTHKSNITIIPNGLRIYF
jgi:membrane-associated phospholipid phosphatase